MFDSVIRSVVAEEYHTVFIIVQADLGHLFAQTNGGGSTSPDVVTSLEIYVLISCLYSLVTQSITAISLLLSSLSDTQPNINSGTDISTGD